jgi:hypothetical protein
MTGAELEARSKLARFTSFQDWAGDYVGHYDGRSAKLKIIVDRVVWNTARFTTSIQFTDSSGHTWMEEVDAGRSHAADEHVIRDVTLISYEPSALPGRSSLSWPRLLIHTWDVNYLSGISLWSGSEFGMSWTRSPRRP